MGGTTKRAVSAPVWPFSANTIPSEVYGLELETPATKTRPFAVLFGRSSAPPRKTCVRPLVSNRESVSDEIDTGTGDTWRAFLRP